MILHFESHSQNIRFSILFTFDFHFLHHSFTELFHNISPHSKCWYFHSLSFTQCTWTFHNLYNFWLEDVLFYMVYHLKTQSSCYFVICNCFNFIIFISDLTAGKCLIEIPFSQRDSDKYQFALWLPHCILVAILPFLFSLSFQLQPEAIVILRQRAWSLRSPQPEKSKMVQVVKKNLIGVMVKSVIVIDIT